MSGLKFPKPRPPALEREDRRKALVSADGAESALVKVRSGGQCEVVIEFRCPRRACHVHHMIGGHGKRARGISQLAKCKQHVCMECHRRIGNGILKRIGGPVPRWTDRYTRAV